jgi:hypothetical protein
MARDAPPGIWWNVSCFFTVTMIGSNALRGVSISAFAVLCLTSIQAAQAPSDSTTKSPSATTDSARDKAAKDKSADKDKKAKTPEATFTERDRLDAIRHAQVWTATDIPSMDMNVGPKGTADDFVAGQSVVCDYVQHSKGSGSTPKFRCDTADGQELKVRYYDRNGEVYAQVAASRLLWALGFGGNRMVPVKVTCRGCPWDPFASDHKEAGQPEAMLFDPATIDIKMEGKTLEANLDEGWAWPEIDKVDEKAGGAPLAQRDALKLLAVMIQHTDSKASNQRLVCLDKELAKSDKKSAKNGAKAAKADESAADQSATDDSATDNSSAAEPVADTKGACDHPFMMLTDVGKTFGKANAGNRDNPGAVNFKEWSKTPVWKDANKPGCVGNMPGSISGTLDNPRISEEGRKFLADLLAKLTDTQLRDLFTVSRFTRRDQSATVDDWVNAFKHKRDEIANRTCNPNQLSSEVMKQLSNEL